jgi:SAM-dependent methyltransferase
MAMAIEAVSQLHHETDDAPTIVGFSLRSVAINSTLQVPDDEFGIETITTMNVTALTTSKTSRWYEFEISSVLPSSDNWTKHCSGSICVETTRRNIPKIDVGHDLRTTDINVWYDKFAEKGVSYGQAFRGLSDLRAYHGEDLATANVLLNPAPDSRYSTYPLHPATLDTCLQLALIACHAGQTERFRNALVPILADNMSVWIPERKANEEILGHGIAAGELRGLRGAYAHAQLFAASGEPILDLRHIRCVLYDGSGNGESKTPSLARSPYMRLIWKPDIASLGNDQARAIFPPSTSLAVMTPLFEKLDKLTTYMIVQFSMSERPIMLRECQKHLEKFLTWVQRRYEDAKSDSLPFASEALSASGCARSEVIEHLSAELNDIVEVRLTKRIYDNLPAILSNETSGLEVALRDNLLTELYVSGLGISAAYPQLLHMVDLVAHKNPRMRVLEIGAGTGGATRLILKHLQGNTPSKRYRDYTFTDVTTSFLSSAETEFAEYKGVKYSTLDIEQDPLEQGFECAYDLVIASDSLHTTSCIAETIQNARKLVKPGGIMVLVELTRILTGTGLLLGTLPDYWNGDRDGRTESPLLDRARWHDVLSSNGFSGIDIILDDYQEPLSAASVMVTTAIEPEIAPSMQRIQNPCVYLVNRERPPAFSATIAKELQKFGHQAIDIPLLDAESIPEMSRVISLIDLDSVMLTNASQTEFDAMKGLISHSSSILWVSAGGLMQASNPETAATMGFLRVVRTEMPATKIISLDLEAGFDQSDAGLARAVIDKECSLQRNAKTLAGDDEYIYSNGCFHISRLVPDKSLNERFQRQEDTSSTFETRQLGDLEPVGLAFENPGLLSSLYFKPDHKFREPLPEDWVELQTSAIGLNMKVSYFAQNRYLLTV